MKWTGKRSCAQKSAKEPVATAESSDKVASTTAVEPDTCVTADAKNSSAKVDTEDVFGVRKQKVTESRAEWQHRGKSITNA